MSKKTEIFLKPLLKEYVFIRLKPDLLKKWNMPAKYDKIPVPFSSADINATKEGFMSGLKIAKNIAVVLGCDSEFPHKEFYLKFIDVIFRGEGAKALVSEALGLEEKQDYLEACAIFSAARNRELNKGKILLEAVYNYGLLCRKIYNDPKLLEKYSLEEGLSKERFVLEERLQEAIVGTFKAEAIETFESITVDFSNFAAPYYHLGYDYLNMGLYVKSKLAFSKFLELASGAEEEEAKLDVSRRIRDLKEPCMIEEGCNLVISGRYEAGLEILKKFADNKNYLSWWPLFFYIATANHELGDYETAVKNYKSVLKMNSLHRESLEGLVDCYYKLHDETNLKKYKQKLELL